MSLTNQKTSVLEQKWEEILYDNIDYPNINVIYEDLFQKIPLLPENFISNILLRKK